MLTDHRDGQSKMNEDGVESIKNLNELGFIMRNFLFEQKISNSLIICYSDLKSLWRSFKSEFVYVKAAGGLVINDQGALLCIMRNGRWDLPKGKAEYNEDLQQTAIREVMEETGLPKPKLISPLNNTYHIYMMGNRYLLKKTCWYTMIAKETAGMKPQEDEGITALRWFPMNEIDEVVYDTYPALRELLINFKGKSWEEFIIRAKSPSSI